MIVGRDYQGEKKKIADSEKEYRRELFLKVIQKENGITGLRKQVRFPLYGKGGTLIARYVADFVYLEPPGRQIVEDVKSEITRGLPVYKLKKRLIKDNYGITITEV